MRELSSDWRSEIEETLLGAFNRDSLERMLRIQLNVSLEQEVNTQTGLKIVVSHLVDWAIRNGSIENLLIGAFKSNSGNQRLSGLIKGLGIEINKIKVNKPESYSLGEIVPGSNLEKIISQRTAFQRFSNFIERLQAMGDQICRIEYPKGTPCGTGWLVGRDLVMTAFHVVEKVYGGSSEMYSQIACRFDYSDTFMEGRVVHLDERWLVDHSNYSLSDLGQSTIEPNDDELDYALIRLAEPVGDDLLKNGRVRGYIRVSPNASTMLQSSDIMLIPQFPSGRPLELAFGDVMNYNQNGTRLTYNTNTEHGSSGSPCFDINLNPFGLHHASGPSDSLRFNQCIPIKKIIKRMSGKNDVPVFWTI